MALKAIMRNKEPIEYNLQGVKSKIRKKSSSMHKNKVIRVDWGKGKNRAGPVV